MNTANKNIINEYLIYNYISSKLKFMVEIDVPNRVRHKLFDILQHLLELRTFFRYDAKNPPYHGYNKIQEEELKTINKFFDEWHLYNTNKELNTKKQYGYNVYKIKDIFLTTINNFYDNYKTYYKRIKDKSISISETNIQFVDIEIDLDDRINMLIKKSGLETTLYMLLRYINYGITGMHCALPYVVYKYIYDEFNVRAEGFSSPLNSKLIFMKDSVICTLFKDTDKSFGSLGPFTYENMITNQDKNWMINPPYMEYIIKLSYDIILEVFKNTTNENLLVFYLIPKWTDNETYKKASANKELLVELIELKGEHYMDCNGRMIIMNDVVNSLFVFSKNKNIINEKQHKKLIEIWSTKSDSSEQSKFHKISKIHQ